MTWIKRPWHVIHSYAHMCVYDLSDRFFSEELRHTYVNLSQKREHLKTKVMILTSYAKFGGPLNFSFQLTNKGLGEWLQEVAIIQKSTVTPESSSPSGRILFLYYQLLHSVNVFSLFY